MSLLGTPVYANPSTPLWASTGNSVMTNVEVTNQLQSDTVLKIGGVGARWYASNPASYGLFASADASGNGYLQTNGTLYMGRTGGTPTTTFVPAAIGTSNDLFTVTGQIQTKSGASVTPQTIATNKTVTNISNSPTINNIANDVAYPTVSNAIYDVSIKGRIVLGGGAPDPDDEVDVVVNSGQNYPGMSWVYAQFPSSATGGPGLFDIRTRIISDAATTSLTAGFTKTLAGGSTATYNGTIYSFNATRVV